MQVSIEAVAALLGHRDIEIFVLQTQVAALQKRIEELTPEAASSTGAAPEAGHLNTP